MVSFTALILAVDRLNSIDPISLAYTLFQMLWGQTMVAVWPPSMRVFTEAECWLFVQVEHEL